jgi:hypothetical protein
MAPVFSQSRLNPSLIEIANIKLHSKIEQGDQEEGGGGVLLVRRSRADAGNEAI